MTRLGGEGGETGFDFAEGLGNEPPSYNKRPAGSIVNNGLFGAEDMGEDEPKQALPGGLFDDSDNEEELQKQFKQIGKEAQPHLQGGTFGMEPPKRKAGGMFDDVDDEEEL